MFYCLVINEHLRRQMDDDRQKHLWFWMALDSWMHRATESTETLVEGVRRADAKLDNSNLLVAMRLGDTPVPIPNTMVKTQAADGTALETVWESRWPPDQKKNNDL